MLAAIPTDYAHRWYVLDAIADAVEVFTKRTPGALATEIQREADAVIRHTFREEYKVSGPIAVFA